MKIKRHTSGTVQIDAIILSLHYICSADAVYQSHKGCYNAYSWTGPLFLIIHSVATLEGEDVMLRGYTNRTIEPDLIFMANSQRPDAMVCNASNCRRLEMPWRSRNFTALDTLHWRHNDHDGVSNHQLHGCLLNRLFRRRSKKTSKLRVTGLCVGDSPGPVNSPHKGPVTQKMFPFDDVIMTWLNTFAVISMWITY